VALSLLEQVLTRKPDDRKNPEGAMPVRGKGKPGKPGWADGLRKLYDGVVAEPLPDSFEDLLKKLDQAGND
jgi:hypothetical protein